MAENQNFLDMVAASPTLTDRWVKVQEAVIKDAHGAYGVKLAPEDIADLLSVRTAVLGNMELGDYQAELEALPAVKSRNLRAQLEREPADTEPRPLTQSGHVAARQLSEAREKGLDTTHAGGTDPTRMSDVEKVGLLLTMPASRRMAQARAWGFKL